MAEVDSSSVDPTYAEIIVVRHGETAWNSERRIQGHTDIELNEVGMQQAEAVADRLSKGPQISHVYSSDLKRAYETAKKIATRCGGLEIIENPNLRERHLGGMQGVCLQDAAQICPEAYNAFLSHKTDIEIPGGGESLDQLYNRCTSAVQKIGQRVVVVTHGGVVRALYKRANEKSMKILNTSVHVFHLTDKNKWILKAGGDVTHLGQSGYLDSGFGGDKTSG